MVRTLLALLAALAAIIAAPAFAQAKPHDARAILGEIGRVTTPNGIDESKAITIGGIKQWITVRGRDKRNPILLVLHGGPAAPELFTRFIFEAPWTDFFTVVEWDQRGAGKTMAINDPARIAPTITVDRMTDDAIELIAYLRRAYHRQKIFLLGHSWGTILGMRVAERRPQWLYAYIGAGQIIDMRAGETIGYRWTLDKARADHNAEAVRELQGIAPYPNPDGSIPLDKIMVERKWSLHYGALGYGRDSYDYLDNAKWISPDYTDAEAKAIDAGSALSLPRLLPAMARTNFTHVHTFDCPVIMFVGRHDYTTPPEPVVQWMAKLQAPAKRLVWFENSAHMMFTDEPGKVLVALVEDALPLARPKP